jgi:hypothetical protein
MGARGRDRTKGTPSPPRGVPARAGPARPGPRVSPALALAGLGLGLALLAWTTRNALHGAPVADDFAFLAHVRLDRFDLFDGGGFPYYWRPLTRQLYYACLGDALLAAPWVAGVVHAAFLLALAHLLHRIGRRTLPPVAALCFALLPFVAESARLLLVWPACAQPLFGTTFAAAAVYAALAGRSLLAALALLAGLLSYEQAAWAAPLVAGLLAREGVPARRRLLRLAPVGLVLALWFAGLAVARSHGVAWPTAGRSDDPAAALAEVVAVVADVDVVPAPWATVLLVAQVVLVGVALALAVRHSRAASSRARREEGGAAPPSRALLACAVLGILGLTPALLTTSGLWAPRHAFLPSLLLGFAVIGVCARAGPGFAPALVLLRALALVLAPVASPLVVDEPIGGARTSFPELVRLQRILESTRRTLAGSGAFDGGGATYWSLPLRSAIAFADGRAPQVWADDSTFRWTWLERPIRTPAQAGMPVVAYDVPAVDPARLVDTLVVHAYYSASMATLAENGPRLDSILLAASLRNGERPGQVLDEIERLRASLATMRGEVALAESLNAASMRRYGMTANHIAIAAWIALARGDEARARELADDCLRNQPNHPAALTLLSMMDARRRSQESSRVTPRPGEAATGSPRGF